MRNRGTIIFVTVVLVLISIYYLSFTVVTRNVEKKAGKYAEAYLNAADLEISEVEKIAIVDSLSKRYLDSVSNIVVYPLIKKYTYMDCKEREINLGLDLRGGMNITLEISAPDVIKALVVNKSDPTMQKAMAEAEKQTKEQTGKNYIESFATAYNAVKDENSPTLASLFITNNNQEKINIRSTDLEVIAYINEEYEAAIANAYDVLIKRIDQFGVVQPNVQKDVAVKGVFHIELPGIKDPERVENLLKQAAVLEFWETFNVNDLLPALAEADAQITAARDASIKSKKANVEEETVVAEEEIIEEETNENIDSEIIYDDAEDVLQTASAEVEEPEITENALFERLIPLGQTQYFNPIVGYALESDRESVMADLNKESIRRLFPKEVVFAWSFKQDPNMPGYYQLIALKKSRNGGAVLGGGAVTNASQEFGQTRATAEVSMTMSGSGATEWARITRENVGKSIAIVLDGYVYSYPNVNDEIKGGRSSITGNFTLGEATDLANVLKSGKMPAPAHILSKEIVGPSLGQKAINSGLGSFIIAFILVLIYMIFYYGRSGLVADISLLFNILLIFGTLAAMGAVLTLPGIAGLVLTIGMAVDANVLIFERTREELRAGKNVKTALNDGYKNAYSAIIDSNVTTLLVGIILLFFGVGPVKGFATTLIIGILSSLFCAIFITKIIFSWWLDKDRKITFGNKFTINAFQNLNIDFIKSRKISYIVSGALIVISLVSLGIRGLNPGIDFAGGRNYVVAFDESVSPEAISDALEEVYGETPIVKIYGGNNQVKISTKYMINEKDAGEIVDSLLYVGLKKGNFIDESVSLKEFYADYRQTSQTVGATVADDIKSKSVIAVLLALVAMFLYILIRFRRWQYSSAAIISLAHNVIIVLGVYSLFYSIMPFNMEVDQSFIAAILTVIGYSINDTVVIFDRLREYLGLYKKRERKDVMNSAINSTISRTVNTTLSTLIVLIAIFIFGGEVIRGFIFAMLIGILVGIYSSVFVATPISYDLMKKSDKK
ncbi:protein translocase subunit SecDF [Bacteroidales bacterium OttesenSCG-928-I21]|nr:protein translocase subunit SecDF [Bacteroidales bacterium OttesenSCG-928-I21]